MTAGVLAYSFRWSVVIDRWPELLAGARLDFMVAAGGFALACALGLVVAVLRRSRLRAVRGPVGLYVQVARGTPPYVLLLWLYFGGAALLDLRPSAVAAAVATIAITGSGYTAEIYRSGVLAVAPSQFDAASSLGMSRLQAYRDVIGPQAMRVMIPPLGNVFVGDLKTATVISVLAAPDMVFVAQDINYTYFRPFEGYTAVAVILMTMVFMISAVVHQLERWLRLP